MGKLNVIKVKNAKAPGRYQDGDGLMLLVKAGGSRSWVLRLQFAGKRRDFGLGSLTDVSLAEAREKAAEMRKLARQGIDPKRTRPTTIPTFADVAKQVYSEQRGSWRNSKHSTQWISSLERYVFSQLGDTQIDKVDAAMVRDTLLPIWLEKPETARRVKQRIGTVLDWAHSNGFRTAEAPMRSVGKGLPKQPKRDNHFSAMPYPDVPYLMQVLKQKEGTGAKALQFLIFTAARSGEVRGAKWREVDLQNAIWTIPAERMKAGREHVVPLPEKALELLDQDGDTRLKESLLFPGLKGLPLSDMTLSKALKSAGGTGYTVHGMRSSFRDWAAERTRFSREVVETALAHAIRNKTEAAYRRTNFLEKRQSLMSLWAEYLVSPEEKVVNII
ncbi:MAG: tyrosine-type recombinase/integrase [Aquisalinus sp.]|nr:tyrosine-type recombinase/integrase [Aquisalinus sp.]